MGGAAVDRHSTCLGGTRGFGAVVIGGSAGGTNALYTILDCLPSDYSIPVVVAHHLHVTDGGHFAEHFASRIALKVTEATDKLRIEPGHVYTAPANYHLLMERDGTLALSIDAKVNCSRPSIDVLFESAARAFSTQLVGVILSGANRDGAKGIELIKRFGGRCIAQDPKTASIPIMPRAAVELAQLESTMAPDEIGRSLRELKPIAPNASLSTPGTTKWPNANPSSS